MMQSLMNYRTTAIGIVLAVAMYLQTIGADWPTTPQAWAAMIVSLIVVGLGAASKDGATGSAPTS